MPWTGEIAKTTFLVRAPAGLSPGPREGTASVYLRGVRLARLFFVVEVVEVLPADKPPRRAALEKKQVRPQTAFASYASRDRREVLKRVQGIEKVGVDVFLDVKSLRSGERYEQRLLQQIDSRDVFYLFWSQAARLSSGDVSGSPTQTAPAPFPGVATFQLRPACATERSDVGPSKKYFPPPARTEPAPLAAS